MELVKEYIDSRTDDVKCEGQHDHHAIVEVHAEWIIKDCREKVAKQWEKRRHKGEDYEFCLAVRRMALDAVHRIRLKHEVTLEYGSQLYRIVTRLPISPVRQVMYEGDNRTNQFIIKIMLLGTVGAAIACLILYIIGV